MRSPSFDRSTFPSFSSFTRIHKHRQSYSICSIVLKQLRGFFCCWTHIYSLHLAISSSLPLRSTALVHANVRHTSMLIKESITQCLYLTVLITSIMYRTDRAISIRNQTLSVVYLLHLFCEKGSLHWQLPGLVAHSLRSLKRSLLFSWNFYNSLLWLLMSGLYF